MNKLNVADIDINNILEVKAITEVLRKHKDKSLSRFFKELCGVINLQNGLTIYETYETCEESEEWITEGELDDFLIHRDDDE